MLGLDGGGGLLLLLGSGAGFLEEEGGDRVGGEAGQREDAVRPGDADVLDGAVGDETIHQPTNTGTRGRQPDGEAPTRGEPRREGGRRGNVGETHAPAEADALAEEQVPGLGGKGRGEQGGGHEEGSREEGVAGADEVRDGGDQGGYEEGLGDGEAADEGVLQVGGLDGGGGEGKVGHYDGPGLGDVLEWVGGQ